MENNLNLEINDKVLEKETKEVFLVSKIYDHEIELTLNKPLGQTKTIPITSFLQNYEILKHFSEYNRLKDFFFQRDEKTSEIILKGLCPNCHKKGINQEWNLFRFAKVCPRCDWVD